MATLLSHLIQSVLMPKLFKKSYEDELNRVIIHGILHLCGINDKGPGEREIMEENENKALALLKEMSDK